jgi:hypothetical protein
VHYEEEPLETAITDRLWTVLIAFMGVKAKKLFVEFQGHWKAAAIGAWCARSL